MGENKSFNNTSFNRVGKFLYDFYLEYMKISTDDLKIIGKVRDYTLEANEDKFDLFNNHYTVLPDKNLDSVDVHLKFVEDEDDYSPFSVKIDINNYDQVSGLTDGSYEDIISFADNFHKGSLCKLLNEKLFGGITGK